MKSFLILVSCVVFFYGDLTSGFHVRWTDNPDLEGYFIEVPEEAQQISGDWSQVTRADERFADYSMYCYKNEITFCAFYDTQSHIRGFQISLLKSAYSGGPVSLDTLGFTTWQYNNQDYWTIQQFFENDASQTTWDLQPKSFYVPTPGNSNNYLQIGNNPDALDTLSFSRKGCLLTMGSHYFHDNSEDCNDILPWLFLYNGQQPVGSGFWLYGNYTFNQPNGPTVDMFEHWTDTENTRIVVADSQCMMENFGKYKIFSMHMFYIDDNSVISC